MSNKRAAIRREQKIRAKMNDKAAKGDKEAITTQIFTSGVDYGMKLASAIFCESLNDLYGFCWSDNGKGRLNKLLAKVSFECTKMESEPTRFTMEYHLKKVENELGLKIE